MRHMKTLAPLITLALAAGVFVGNAHAQALPADWSLSPTLSANYD